VSISHSLKLVPPSLSRSLNHCPVPLAFSLVLHRSPFPSLSISVLFLISISISPSQSCSLLISTIYISKSNRYGLIDMYLTVLVAEFRT
ncbi:hypothetical protein ISN45_Aa03g035420, partial [Arabidopsis thaliana x Arabidopsis arenosa]